MERSSLVHPRAAACRSPILAVAAALLVGLACRGDSTDAVSVAAEGAPESDALLGKRVLALRLENDRLAGRLSKLVPKEPYIVINTTLNRIYLRAGEDTLVNAVCSTGSNTELISPDGSRRWFFSTPRGVFRVRSRQERPIWVRPDWAFVEEGEPIPSATAPERYEKGVLGDYGLYLGDGYLIHGTLFERFLGQNVTHGCIRVGDEALEKIWKSTKIGTPVYIF